MTNTTLCYLERDGCYLMLHRVKKENDMNRDKWLGYRGIVTFVSDQYPTEYMHLFHSAAFRGTLRECDEGTLEWVPKAKVPELPIWEGDKLFLSLLDEDRPFFSLKLEYRGDHLAAATLNGTRIKN